MISEKDLEGMGYFEMFSSSPQYSKTLIDYSKWVEKKMLTHGHDRLVENTLGLVGEAGEVAEKIKKKIRDGEKVTSDEIIKELGDVLFYTTALANYFLSDIGVVMEMNITKLDDREKRGTLKGSGDNR
jgi:NTP pyrophosphatase (non-canonical NTP hydrolase)